MFHRNIVRFVESGRELELLAEGTMWPKEIHVDGDAWIMGTVVENGEGYAVREYEHAKRMTPGQRLLKAITGGL